MAIAQNLKNGIGFGSSELYVFRTLDNHSTNFLYYFLQSEDFIKSCTNEMTGAAGLKRVPSDFILGFKFPLIQKSEQQKIANFLDKKTSEIDSTIAKIKTQVKKIKEAKQSLISEAVTGKIEVL